ncbi:MAG: Dna2/Cas4 domain-containing protein [Methanotrichaceae archaeon]|nr:Dna2/Cas4 domain-containing protein [Methanotrichaceae archaeon]
MAPLVRISDISLYLRCPRLVYFDSLGKLDQAADPERLLLRSMMLSLDPASDPACQLKPIMDDLLQDLPLVYEIDGALLNQAAAGLEPKLSEIAANLSCCRDRLFPSEVEVDLRSEKLRLTGRLDRLIFPDLVPSLIRTGSPPADGVWKSDRLALAGYSLMLDEMHSTRVRQGLVEYARSGTVREVEIRSIDRARALRIRDRVRQIRDGQLPDRPRDARCDQCRMRERCETRKTLASRFF